MTTPPEAPIIFLVNQISNHGHLDLYARLYSACLLDLGYRVVLIAQNESGICEWIAENRAQRAADFSFFARAELRPDYDSCSSTTAAAAANDLNVVPVPPLHSRLLRVWKKEGIRGICLRVDLHTLQYRHWMRCKLDVVISRLEYPNTWVFRLLRSVFSPPRGVSFRPIVEELNVARKRLGINPTLVFFLYLDMMNDDHDGCRYLDQYLDAPWAGILFHPHRSSEIDRNRLERFFYCNNARGAAFLNTNCVSPYQKLFPKLRFDGFPDVSDASTPLTEPELVTRLRRGARGRTIVLQMGSLSPHKGIEQFIDVIRRADSSRYFFAIIGEFFWESFGKSESELRQFAKNPPENCVVQPGYIEDERELNSIIELADVLYAVYSDFRPSSNTLTKAAQFEKPVIVSDQYLMGERVRRYSIGATVKFGDTDAIIGALDLLLRRPRREFGFQKYSRDHSIEVLKEALKILVPRWIDGKSRADSAPFSS